MQFLNIASAVLSVARQLKPHHNVSYKYMVAMEFTLLKTVMTINTRLVAQSFDLTWLNQNTAVAAAIGKHHMVNSESPSS